MLRVIAGNSLGDFVAAAMTDPRAGKEKVTTAVVVGEEGRVLHDVPGMRVAGENGIVRLTPSLLSELPLDLDWVRAAQDAPVDLILLDSDLPTRSACDVLVSLQREYGFQGIEVLSVGGPYRCSCGTATRLMAPGPSGNAVEALLSVLASYSVCIVGSGNGSADSFTHYWEYVSGLTSAQDSRIVGSVARQFSACIAENCSDTLALVCAGAMGFEGEVETFPAGEVVRVDRNSARIVRFAAEDEPLAVEPHECAAVPADRKPAGERTGEPTRGHDALTWRRLAQTMGIVGSGAVSRTVDKLVDMGAEVTNFPVHRV
ncbi:hypothetical protein [Streptomyces sp. YIM S03343]